MLVKMLSYSNLSSLLGIKRQSATPENIIILFVCPPKFCISIVSSLYWDLQWSQEKTKTMLIQNLGGQTKSIMVFSGMANWILSLTMKGTNSILFLVVK